MEKYREEIQEKEQQKAADKGDEDRSSINKEFLDQLREAKIECTEDLFLNILKIDEDNQKLKFLPKYQETVGKFDEDIKDLNRAFQSKMRELNEKKKQTIEFCEEILKKSEVDSEKDSIVQIKEFQRIRKYVQMQLNLFSDLQRLY